MKIKNFNFKKSFSIFLIYGLFFIITFGVSNTYIYSVRLTPFGIGIIFSLFAYGFSGFYLAVVYVFAYVLAGGLAGLLSSLNVAGILILLQIFNKKKTITNSRVLIFLFATLSQIAYVVSNLGDSNHNLALIISVLLGLLFLYSCLSFCNAISTYSVSGRINLDEKICGVVILLIFSLGIYCVKLSIVNLGWVFASIILLFGTYILSFGTNLTISAVIGIAFAISTSSSEYISLLIVMALMSVAFKCNFKYLSGISLFVGYLIYILIFNAGIVLGDMLSIGIGVFFFYVFPLKIVIRKFSIFNIKNKVLVANIIDRTKKQIVSRVTELAKVFSQMDNIYRGMVKGNLNDKDAIELIKSELVKSKCCSCINYNNCYRTNGNFMESAVDTIVNIGYEKGKVSLVDIPQYLTTNCIGINDLLSVLNNMLLTYKDYEKSISNLDTSRVLIADQLSGISGLLNALSKDVDIALKFDEGIENYIIEELSYKKIVCYECAIYQKDIKTKFITLIVKTDTIDKQIIEKVIKKKLGINMKVQSIEPSEIANASDIELITTPNYDIAFGSSSINKTGKRVSGDNRTVVKIADGKYMVSICDGMGSGNKARDISSLTISLIENFYLAGFDNEIILSSINKLLSLSEQENFSTIDLCVIDGRSNIYDFVKLGATNGYLKRQSGKCEIIESSGLPVGVLESIKPHITKKTIQPLDMLVLVSDGVTDSFNGKLDLSMFIQNCDIINPQTLSEEILKKSLELNGGIAIDDMTVVCVRVFEC